MTLKEASRGDSMLQSTMGTSAMRNDMSNTFQISRQQEGWRFNHSIDSIKQLDQNIGFNSTTQRFSYLKEINQKESPGPGSYKQDQNQTIAHNAKKSLLSTISSGNNGFIQVHNAS